MIHSLFDLLRCMDDIFIASFGGFCDFIVSEAFVMDFIKTLHDRMI